MRLTRLIIVALTGAISGVWQDVCVAADRGSELAVIRQAGADYLKAVEQEDLAAISAAWTAEGDYIDTEGRTVKVREWIQKKSPGESTGPAGQRQTWTSQIRLLTPDVAIEDGTSEVRLSSSEPPVRTRHTVVWVKQEGRWLLSCLRESTLTDERRAPPFQELSWLLGEFAGEADDDTLVVTSAAASRDGNYVLRRFFVTSPEGHSRTLEQRIGWDPVWGRFKSWTFDSDGSYSEGVWKRQGQDWLVTSSGVSADGTRTASLNKYSRISENGFVLESVGASVDGESHPDVKVKLTRQAAPK